MALTHLQDLFFQNNALMLLATFSAELLRDPEEVVLKKKNCPLGRRVVPVTKDYVQQHLHLKLLLMNQNQNLTYEPA